MLKDRDRTTFKFNTSKLERVYRRYDISKKVQKKEQEQPKQKTLFFAPKITKINTSPDYERLYTRHCNTCNRIFQSPYKNYRPKCILCKIEAGSLNEAKSDLNLYYKTKLNKNAL